MKKISVDLENCYGIGSLQCEFDFNKAPVHAVYAPNGIMKSSFARTFKDISDGVSSTDRMFQKRVTRREVLDESGVAVGPDQVLVIEPYVDNYQPKQASTLLVDATLKRRYEEAITAIEQRKKALLDALKERSRLTGRTVTPESELTTVFRVGHVVDALDAMHSAAQQADVSISDIQYATFFGEKSVQFLKDPKTLQQIDAYVKQYDDLISKSPVLTAEFSHTQANAVHRSLQDSKFFDATHWVVLNDSGGAVEIRSADQLRERVDLELQRVLSDPVLRKTFDAFDKKIATNVELRELRAYLQAHPKWLPRLKDLESLRRDVWAAYLSSEGSLLEALRDAYASSRAVIQEVVKAAQSQATEWAEVVKRFNERFHVPFRLRVENQSDVILKEAAPRVVFDFIDEADTASGVAPDSILKTLSGGERRAFYLLNVLFDIRTRQKSGRPVLVVADDIADSFDYRNKYAIIEYLQDVVTSDGFRLIILTHNFDFHRSVSSRLDVPRQNRRLAMRNDREVDLVAEKYQGNPMKVWQDSPSDAAMFLASVPFVRNLAEYCGHDDVCEALTQVLHLKAQTKTLTLGDLDDAYLRVNRGYKAPSARARQATVYDLLRATAEDIANRTGVHVELEAKVVLSMAIRLIAEEHMIMAIADPKFVSGITKNQTQGLLTKYRKVGLGAAGKLSVLERVQLMTPENIHLNSFMFEPILDLGIDHLRKLYREVSAL